MEQITTQLPAGFTAGQLFDVSLPGRAYVARLAFPANMQAGDTFVFQARRPRDRSRAARFSVPPPSARPLSAVLAPQVPTQPAPQVPTQLAPQTEKEEELVEWEEEDAWTRELSESAQRCTDVHATLPNGWTLFPHQARLSPSGQPSALAAATRDPLTRG